MCHKYGIISATTSIWLQYRCVCVTSALYGLPNHPLKHHPPSLHLNKSTVVSVLFTATTPSLFVLFCCSRRNPQVVAYSAQPLCWSGWENASPTTHRGAVQYGKMDPKYPEGGHCQSVTSSGFLTSPFILNNSVETAAPFNVVGTHDVVSREINLW